VAAGGDDLAAILRHKQRRRIHAHDAADEMPAFVFGRRRAVRPWRAFQKLDSLLAVHADDNAAVGGLGVEPTHDAAFELVLAVADAAGCRGERDHRHAQRLGIGKAADAGLIKTDPGIMMDGGAKATLHGEIGGIDRGM